MKQLTISIFLVCIIALVACNSSDKSADKTAQSTITELEEKLFNGSKTKFNDAIAKQLVEMYKGYADANPKDSLSAEYLFRAGELCLGLEQYEKGITFFERVYKGYPDYDKYVESLFMVGFIYDEHLKRKGMAADYYQRVVKQHPNHHFASVSKQVLETLTMSEEELLKKFEEQNKKAS